MPDLWLSRLAIVEDQKASSRHPLGQGFNRKGRKAACEVAISQPQNYAKAASQIYQSRPAVGRKLRNLRIRDTSVVASSHHLLDTKYGLWCK